MIAKERVLAAEVLAKIAGYIGVEPDELGSEWVAFADAVAGVVASHVTEDRDAIGALVISAVKLP